MSAPANVLGLLTIKLVTSTGEQASGILVAAAAPVTLLTALSKSSLGQQVQERLNERLPQLEEEAAALRQQQAGAAACGVVVDAAVWRWTI
jgi:light-harvesting complex II chlorophyll a/b binding protein 7